MTALAAFGFLIAVMPLVLTPGASFSLTTQHTLTGRPRAAGWVIAGTATGIYVHALLAAAGLSAIVMRSAVAFTVVKMSIWPMLIMASIHVVVMSLWLGIWASALVRSKRLVRSRRFSAYVNRVGGAVLIALGIRTVAT